VDGPVTARLCLDDPGAGADLDLFAARAAAMDAGALVRVRGTGTGVTVWALLPYGVLIGRGVAARLVGADDVTVAAAELSASMTELPPDASGRALPPDASGSAAAGQVVDLPQSRDAQWRGSLPGGSFVRLDEVPSEVLRQLATAGRRAFDELRRQPGTPAGSQVAGEALLDSEVLRVSGEAGAVGVPLKLVNALHRMRFLGAGPVRVAMNPGWLRLAATYGAAHVRRTPL
jgi:hypothetical protein